MYRRYDSHQVYLSSPHRQVSLITMFAGQLGSLFLLLCLDYEALRDCVSYISENSSEASKARTPSLFACMDWLFVTSARPLTP